MSDPTLEAVAEGERRALREWQAEHQEPCDDCEWTVYRDWSGLNIKRALTDPCPRHGGRP